MFYFVYRKYFLEYWEIYCNLGPIFTLFFSAKHTYLKAQLHRINGFKRGFSTLPQQMLGQEIIGVVPKEGTQSLRTISRAQLCRGIFFLPLLNSAEAGNWGWKAK